MFSFSLSKATVIDVFAGTGAIGLEALSRGAKSCVFVEQDQDALQTLQANISKLKQEIMLKRYFLKQNLILRFCRAVFSLGNLP